MSIGTNQLRIALSAQADVGGDDVYGVLPEVCPDLFVQGVELRACRLKSRVIHVTWRSPSGDGSVILKCLKPVAAERGELVLRRWLPNMGLAHAAPTLIGTVGTKRGNYVWHVYEDVGRTVLDPGSSDQASISIVVELIAALHTSAARSPLLPECQQYLVDFGIHYFKTNVSGAHAGVASLLALRRRFSDAQRNVHRRLHDLLSELLASVPSRMQLVRDVAEPNTLLHGDLWTTNTLLVPGHEGNRARLIDWDHAGVGPISYDLSTFLYRFPADQRAGILDLYRNMVGRAGWSLPSVSDLNALFETAECARYANRVIWPAMALLGDDGEWGHAELAETLEWFEALTPVLSD